ncbi:nucleic acid-binding, OB-fold protein [Tanacetum coccineum]
MNNLSPIKIQPEKALNAELLCKMLFIEAAKETIIQENQQSAQNHAIFQSAPKLQTWSGSTNTATGMHFFIAGTNWMWMFTTAQSLSWSGRGQSLRVTLWGQLGDVLVEKKTRHAGVCAMVLTGMSVKEYNNKLYLSSTSSTVFCDDDDIPCLQELRADDSRTAPIKAPLPIDCTQPREGTLENLLIWARNRQNNTATFHCKVMIENFRTKKGWNYPSCGYEKCRKGASRKNGKWVCEACNRSIDYPVFR